MIRQLCINDYRVLIVLGNNDFEKCKKCKVSLEICLRFSEKCDGCYDDNINSTVCYSKLLHLIDQKLEHTEFNLVERVTQFLYDEISKYLGDITISKRVKVTKLDPLIENLSTSSFICSDW